MQKDFSTFLSVHRGVCRLGLDISISGDELDETHKPIQLSHDQFFEHLYEPRSVEGPLKHKIRTSNDLICFVGPQGAGKSTVANKIIRDFRQSRRFKTFIVFIDIRTITGLKEFPGETVATFETYLRQRIIDQYMRELFLVTRNDDSRRIDLYAYLLEQREDKYKPFQIFSSFRSLEDRALRLIKLYERTSPERKGISVRDWLLQTYLKEDDVKDLTLAAEELVDIAHLVYAARVIHRYERQIIWIDNVDALEEELQSDAVTFIRKFYQQVYTYVSALINVREENVFRYHDVTDEGAPPFDSRVILEMPRDDAQHHYYPAVDIPVAKKETIQGIINKRLRLTRRLQQYVAEQDTTEIQSLEEQLSETKSGKLGDDREVSLTLREAQEGIADFTPIISNESFDSLCQLSDNLLETLTTEKALYVTNNSLRDLLFVHRDCLGYFLKSPNEDATKPEAIHYKSWYRSTLFLSWLRYTLRKYQVGVYDMVAFTENWYALRKKPLGCFLPHLLMTSIWNLTLENRDAEGSLCNIPRLNEVIGRLSLLEYQSAEVKKRLHSLYYKHGTRGNLIEIREKELVKSPSGLKEDHFVYLTYRAKCLTAFTTNSFGYFYGCVRTHKDGADASPIPHPDVESTEGALAEMLPFLCDIAEMHIAALHRIRESGNLGDEDWLNRYYLYFAIPLVKPYMRSGAPKKDAPKVGRSLGRGGIRRALQFEALLESFSSYVRQREGSRELRTISNRFYSELSELEDGRETAEIRTSHRYRSDIDLYERGDCRERERDPHAL